MSNVNYQTILFGLRQTCEYNEAIYSQFHCSCSTSCIRWRVIVDKCPGSSCQMYMLIYEESPNRVRKLGLELHFSLPASWDLINEIWTQKSFQNATGWLNIFGIKVPYGLWNLSPRLVYTVIMLLILTVALFFRAWHSLQVNSAFSPLFGREWSNLDNPHNLIQGITSRWAPTTHSIPCFFGKMSRKWIYFSPLSK